MKKYILIELGDNYPQNLETYASFDEAATAMRDHMVRKRNNFYRIEEVEESITDRVKSYEDAREIDRNVAVESLIDYLEKNFATQFTAHIIALLKLETITAALNEGWKPDWEDVNQAKWMVWYDADKNTCWVTECNVCAPMPSRLSFKSRELAEYAAKQFADLYRQLLIEKF